MGHMQGDAPTAVNHTLTPSLVQTYYKQISPRKIPQYVPYKIPIFVYVLLYNHVLCKLGRTVDSV